MLLTLAASSLQAQLDGGDPALTPLDLPKYAREEFNLRGLHIHTGLLSGWSAAQIDRLRDRADKAGCPCLVLYETGPLKIGDIDDDTAEAAIKRVEAILVAAHRLGCPSVAIVPEDPKHEDAEDYLADGLKMLVRKAERYEINVLIYPGDGLTAQPESLTQLIRKVGGFRVGSFPSFTQAAGAGDPVAYLKAVTPYAAAVTACVGLNGGPKAKDVGPYLDALQAVGFDGTLGLLCPAGADAPKRIAAARDAVETALNPENDDD